MLVADPEEQSLIPGTYIMEEGTDFCKLSSDLHIRAMACVFPYNTHGGRRGIC